MNLFKAIGLKLISALLFAVMSALVRKLGNIAPVGQMVFFRSAFAIVPRSIPAGRSASSAAACSAYSACSPISPR